MIKKNKDGVINMEDKELTEVRDELLSREDQYITFKDLVERFDKIDKEYQGKSWNLLQIYSNFNILIGKKEKELAANVSEQKPKRGKWLNGELIPNDITGHWYAECSECGKMRIIDNFCPNCGVKMEEEE